MTQEMLLPAQISHNNFVAEAHKFVEENGEWYLFHGRAFPETSSVSVDVPIYTLFECTDGKRIASQIHIADNQIRVRAFSSEHDLLTVRNILQDQSQSILDYATLGTASWWIVEMCNATKEDGSFGVFINMYTAIANEPVDLAPSEMFSLGSNEALSIALANFRESLRSALDSGMHCYRAVEAVMQSFKDVNDDDKKGWQKLNAALNVDADFTKTQIKLYADHRRHGGASFAITGADRDKCIRATRQIIHRYCHYLKASKTRLDLATFPMLTP